MFEYVKGTMNQITPLTHLKRKDRPFYFSRGEFTAIIAAYSLRVAAAEWRDYALDHTPKAAFFSIFKSSHETPIFVNPLYQYIS